MLRAATNRRHTQALSRRSSFAGIANSENEQPVVNRRQTISHASPKRALSSCSPRAGGSSTKRSRREQKAYERALQKERQRQKIRKKQILETAQQRIFDLERNRQKLKREAVLAEDREDFDEAATMKTEVAELKRKIDSLQEKVASGDSESLAFLLDAPKETSDESSAASAAEPSQSAAALRVSTLPHNMTTEPVATAEAARATNRSSGALELNCNVSTPLAGPGSSKPQGLPRRVARRIDAGAVSVRRSSFGGNLNDSSIAHEASSATPGAGSVATSVAAPVAAAVAEPASTPRSIKLDQSFSNARAADMNASAPPMAVPVVGYASNAHTPGRAAHPNDSAPASANAEVPDALTASEAAILEAAATIVRTRRRAPQVVDQACKCVVM